MKNKITQKKMLTKLVYLLFVLLISTASVHAQQNKSDDYKAVEQAIKDYVDAIYDSDTSKIYKSVHPDLVKRGFFFRDGNPVVSPMTFSRLINVAKTWRKPDMKPVEPQITVFEVLDLTASGKVKADWGIDYFHLSKISGEWKIYNVMWQKHPPEKN